MNHLIQFKRLFNNEISKIKTIARNSGTPEDIWKDIVHIIKVLQNNNNKKTLTFDSLTNEMIMLNDYSEQCETSYWIIDYCIDVIYTDDVVTIKAYPVKGRYKEIITFENRYIISYANEGNCIDDFLIRGVQPQLANINDMIESIESRLPERQVAIEYHGTGCYEKDFRQISLIRNFAQKIVDNCNAQLERVSESYTKL